MGPSNDTMKKIQTVFAGAAFMLAGNSFAATLTALTTFGGGDGVLLPADYSGSTTGSFERGMDFNPATGDLILASTNGGNALRPINSSTGVVGSALTIPPISVSGLRAWNMVAVTTSGEIYVTNLSGNASSTTQMQVYKYLSQADTAPTKKEFTIPINHRAGDALAVTGSGVGAILATGYNSVTTPPTPAPAGTDGWAALNYEAGTITSYDPASGSSVGGFRLGMTWLNSTDVIGANTAGVTIGSASGPTATTITGLATTTEPILDVVTILGKTYLATMDASTATNRNKVRVYELNGSVASFLADGQLITGSSSFSNSNATGSLAWGTVSGDTATLYSLTTNNGIQAFLFTIPEPSSALLGVAGLGVLMRRRRK